MTVAPLIAQLRAASTALRSDEVGHALRTVTAADAAALRQAILGMTAFLDDSVSNPHLGSLFDRTSGAPLNKLAEALAEVYGVARTYPSTTGTSALNVPAVMTLASEHESIAIARDCHVSVLAGVSLSGASPVYVMPPFNAELGVGLPPTPNEVSDLLRRAPRTRGLVVTMPTYHGLMGDVEGIVRVCHERGVVVMVDEAHGPHFRFLRHLGFPVSAEDAGADVVTQSTHKVLAALNQASLLHFNNVELVRRYEELQALGFQSTSFSYPLLLSIEQAIEHVTGDGLCAWSRAIDLAERFRDGASRIAGIRVLDASAVDGHRVIGLDPTRVTIHVARTGWSGYAVRDALVERGNLVEMATLDVLLFLVSPSADREQIDSTLRDLAGILRSPPPEGRVLVDARPASLPPQVMTPRRAVMTRKRDRIPRRKAVGCVSAETISAYPPGQAVFVAGERITAEGLDFLERVVASGGHLKRVLDDNFEQIEVIVQ